MLDEDELLQEEEPTTEETYGALRRHLQRRDGFGLVFVRCAPADVAEIVERLEGNIPEKKMGILALDEPVTDLYDLVAEKIESQPLEVVFITGFEKSLVDDIRPGLGGKGDYYNENTIQLVLGSLNLQREKFRDQLKTCLVFFVPIFAIRYLLRRAQDFFDWRTSIYEFPMQTEALREKSHQVWLEGDYNEYCVLSSADRKNKILEICDLLEEENQTLGEKQRLWFELGNLFTADLAYEEAIAAYDQALHIKPDKDEAWNNRGIALRKLGRYEEAIAAYDQALHIKPDKDEAWNNRGYALDELGRYEEAIAAYDQALHIKPDKDEAWYNRGYALDKLGRYEEAIAAYDQVLHIKPDDHEAWYNRGIALRKLGRYEEAIAAYDQALHIKPDDHAAWYSRGLVLQKVGRRREAQRSLLKAIELNPEWFWKQVRVAWRSRMTSLLSKFRVSKIIKPIDCVGCVRRLFSKI
ncbi:MAG: tetratricopeptide repeat protein [Cyanobacteria bacterium P01_G01_bin.54]